MFACQRQRKARFVAGLAHYSCHTWPGAALADSALFAVAGLTVALVAIANSLDLTERMLPALKCRGVAPDFVSFPAYSKSQVSTMRMVLLLLHLHECG